MTADIAIIGAAFRFPGAADDDALDRLLGDGPAPGREPIRPPPPERWPFHRPDPDGAERAPPTLCGFLDDAFDFDAERFHVSPREARLLDPQHRMALELAFLAQEDAGLGGGALAGTRTGVFVGTTRTDYLEAIAPYLGPADYMAALANARAVLANRVSSIFDLRGPSLSIDTLCSSSAVAVHHACRALRSSDCDVALAGGVNILMSPSYLSVLRRLNLLSPTAKCRPFGSAADGFVPSEGGAILCLRRLEDAQREGDPIRAVIRGTGIAHHGRSAGLTVPDPEAIAQAMRAALDDAGLAADQIGLVQAMGAGSPLTDRAEMRALDAVFGAGPHGTGLPVSCDKAVLGHLEPASGVAGLISAIRQLERALRFPVHAEASALGAGTRLRLIAQLEHWTADEPRRVGVSSLGMTGTHVHLVLEQAARPVRGEGEGEGWMVLPVAADSAAGLARSIEDHAAACIRWSEAEARDACFTAATGRHHGRFRAAIVADSAATLGCRLEALHTGGPAPKGITVARGTASTAVPTRASGARAPFSPTGRVERAAAEALAWAFVEGAAADWDSLQAGPRRRLRIPTTQLDRSRFLFTPPARAAAVPAAPAPVALHPLLRGARRTGT